MESPPESEIWLQELEKHLQPEEIPAYRLALYGHRASTICAKIRKVVDGSGSDTSGLSSEILIEVESFENESVEPWIIQPDLMKSPQQGKDATETARDLRLVSCRTFYYAFRLKLQLSLLELLWKIERDQPEKVTGLLQSQLHRRVANVQSTADEILAYVPLILGTENPAPSLPPSPSSSSSAVAGAAAAAAPRQILWTDGVRILWPLRLVALWHSTRQDQKMRAGSTLRQIRRQMWNWTGGEKEPSPSVLVV